MQVSAGTARNYDLWHPSRDKATCSGVGPKSARSESRWRTAGHAMSSVRLLKRKGKLFFDFRVRGVRCRGYTALADSEANRKRLKKVLDRIEAEIASGTFDYRRFFPESNLASQFDVPMATATSALDKAMPETALFRDFADKWYVQHEIEWKRSYRRTVRGALDQHLITHFGEKDVGRITKEEILNFRSALGKVPGRKNKGGLSAQRINHVMGVLRRVLEDAADRFHFTNPYQRIKPLKLTKSDVQPFTMTEVQSILKTVRKDFENSLKVRFFTGMRTGEAEELKWR